MKLFPAIDKFEKSYFSFLLAFLPLSFIAGNLVINSNIILILLSAILFYRKKIFSLNYLLIDKLIFSYFFLIIFTGIYNDIQMKIFHEEFSDFRGNFYTTMKSFLFLKYLLLYLVLRYLIDKDILKLKIFFTICSLASVFVCFDIFFQFINGKDIFGFVSPGYLNADGRKLGGPFGDELIAGGYIQRFSLFAFFTIPIFYKNSLNKFQIYIIPFLLIVFIIGIILSGNRMPFLLYLALLTLILLFQKQARKFFFPLIFLVSITFFAAFNFNLKVKENFINFYFQINQIKTALFSNDSSYKNTPFYIREFATFYDTWRLNKYIGGGVKNFRYYCHERENIDKNSKFVCNMHPHNYYLEILTETGVIGFSILIYIVFVALYMTLYKKYFSKISLQNNNIIIPFIFLFFIEMFPIKSTGSFFTTGNSTYLFLILGVLVGLSQKDNLIEKKI
tara:strand:- start:1406 stop:2749 length:1344 start_codon:yes stop_codon:yes gene_type:complete